MKPTIFPLEDSLCVLTTIGSESKKKRKRREASISHKRRRIERKKARTSDVQQREILDGLSYQSGIQISSKKFQPDLTVISTPLHQPVPTAISTAEITKPEVVVFDLETSNLVNRSSSI